jgi:CzcA family heavy metal efflux pump
MWIVRLALRRPYTFVVMAFLIVILGGVTLARMPTDIFPEIDIPVISVVWNYAGLPPEEMESRVVSNYERALTTTVNDIQRIESQTLSGIAVVKIFFQPGAKIEAATAQVTAISQAVLRQFPPGITPPLIIRYSASNVPILQLALESDTLSEQEIFDQANSFLRTGLATIQGAQMPWPYGGKVRQVMVDLDLDRLSGWGLSPADVSNAVNAQNLILPSGTVKVGNNEYPVELNSSPLTVDELNDLPIKTVNGTTLYVKDVAHVRDGFAPQNSMVHSNGKRAVLESILKSGGASTLDIVARIRAALPQIMTTLPRDLRINLLFDQSIFVRAAISSVLREAAIAAGLTALMILLFLGSWRSTVIILVSIPLSILVSIIVLGALGETLNTMTLGGMALAVGILVDDATVEIENIHRNLGQRKPLVRAILDGAQQIAVPAFVSTICICIVFVPVAFISGAAKSLFIPLALAVCLAMMTSYFLSRTLVPTMVHKLLAPEVARELLGKHDVSLLGRIHGRVDGGFNKLRESYGAALDWVLQHRRPFLWVFGTAVACSMALVPFLGRDFFPSVDAGQVKLHVRGRPGTRLEESEQTFARVEEAIREVVPPAEIETLLDNIGIPNSGINLSLSDGSLVSSADGEILIALKENRSRPTAEYVGGIRRKLRERFPGLTVFFQAPDISTQVLNFGLQAPIDIQLAGPLQNLEKDEALAHQLAKDVATIPGAVDVHLQQLTGVPNVHVNVDRTLANEVGLTQQNVANDVLVSLASSGQVSPSYWMDPFKGTQYSVAVQTPQYRLPSLDALATTPLFSARGTGTTQPLLTSVAGFQHSEGPANITHHNVMPTFDVLVNVEGTDLASVSGSVDEKIAALKPRLPRGTSIQVLGQVESMKASFRGLSFGILFAVVLVYLLLAVNFQSWLDPLIILMALPGALAGIAWMLFVSQTTLSVPALMGAMMCIGVATANSILVVTFANDQRKAGHDAVEAAHSAGVTRLRPVMMTAMAMILGMLPMALGLGEGGEANAPLGRAVVGGLLLATVATLFFVPVMYSLWRTQPPLNTDYLEGE